MSEKNPSQAQQTIEGWRRSVDEGVAQMQAGFEEMAKLEQAAAEQMRAVLTDAARLQQEALAYAGKLSAEWRKFGLDAFKRGAELFSDRG